LFFKITKFGAIFVGNFLYIIFFFMVKNFFVFLFFVFVFVSCGPEKKVRITGKLTGSNAEKIYLSELGNNSKLSIDSAKIDAKGNFSFKRKISQPTFYSLTVNDKTITLLINPGEKIVINGDVNNLPSTYSIKGSKDSEHIRMLYRRLEQTVSVRDSLIRTLKQFEDNRNYVNIQRQFEWTYLNELDSLRAFNINFMEKNPKSLVVLYALYQQIDRDVYLFDQEDDIRYFRRADSAFFRRYPKVAYVNMLRSHVFEMNVQHNRLEWSRLLSMLGQDAPEIALPAPNGNIMKLSANKGKFVLVDFWASWSAPCRTENINLLNIYNKYREEGFEIFQVSLDQSKEAWELAIKEDGLPWTNVSDLKNWESDIVKLYGVETIPANFLIDREGSIISKNLKSDALDRKLNEFITAFK